MFKNISKKSGGSYFSLLFATAIIVLWLSLHSSAQTPNSAMNLLLYSKTQAPADIVMRDADVISSKMLLSNEPSTQGLTAEKFRAAAEARRNVFVQTHYHVGRIEIRRAAAAKAGRLSEKEKLLQEAIKKWALNLDTHSMAPPKPTMESIAVLEPAEETFARHLAEAYDRQLTEIQQQLISLLRLIAVDAESLWASEGSKRVAESLPMKAQEEKDHGRKSLGGQPQVDEFAWSLSRVIVPVLAELGNTESAQSPSDALTKLVEALAKAEAGMAADAAREQQGKSHLIEQPRYSSLTFFLCTEFDEKDWPKKVKNSFTKEDGDLFLFLYWGKENIGKLYCYAIFKNTPSGWSWRATSVTRQITEDHEKVYLSPVSKILDTEGPGNYLIEVYWAPPGMKSIDAFKTKKLILIKGFQYNLGN